MSSVFLRVKLLREEEWRPVVGWEGLYEVSSHGRVRSLDRQVRDLKGILRNRKGKIRALTRTHQGYSRVMLRRGAEKSQRTVHQLVLESFVGTRPPGKHMALHRNGLRGDNSPHNLYWGDNSDNQRDAVTHGTHYMTAKTHCLRGHEFTPGNTYVSPAGHRNCRKCRTLREGSNV